MIEYYIRLRGPDDEHKSIKAIDHKITLEGEKGESGARVIKSKKLPNGGYECFIEAVTIGAPKSILVEKKENTVLFQTAVLKEGRYGATEYLFEWEE